MEFHVSGAMREELGLDDAPFSYTGNVVFANVAASRAMAAKLGAWREAKAAGGEAKPAEVVNAGALFAMGLIDELNHALIASYRKTTDPAVWAEAVRWIATQTDAAAAEKLLLTFAERFPNTAVFRGEQTAAEWMAGVTAGEDGELPHREAEAEELVLLWLTNRNPAYGPFRELFDDAPLRAETVYGEVTAALPAYFQSRPPLSAEVGSLLDALQAPFLASPESLAGQLEYIREHWSEYVGVDLRRVLLAVDTLREEDIAIWMRFHPAAPDRYRHGAPGGGEGFRGDEYIGFDDQYEWVEGSDGVRTRRLRYATDYQAPLNEYEAFSADQAWMPNVVMMAKSTYVWLEQLSKKYRRHIHKLDQVPDEELQLMADRGMTALWLIGLWERSTASRVIKHLRGQSDAVASAYSLKRYEIAEDLGGRAAYDDLRVRAGRVGLRLASDMVPNHMGIDADWVIEHPDWFLSRPESPFPSYSFTGPDLSTDGRVEIKLEDHYYDQTDAAVVFRLRHHAGGETRFVYHGNDGTTFAWNDTAQIDYSKAFVREQVIGVILYVARMFPIIRFDAAMVLAKRHVQRLWFPLPGAGGSIPSRAESAISQEEFDALMPQEFWREVVDRVAAEVPGTLLLAEAFWMLEGYFVRTLGMHRVYNSAFMNMLRDEENAKYRSYLKKTMEFDPDILKRYVNFMSNPDERTTIDQFGSGDKCFGVATLMATLPGLPMFGHGQIEGYTERYGMEYKQAKFDEWPDEGLVARHQHEIAPLLHRRSIFAESANFVLYDFWAENGTVDENVFAYSNRSGSERSLVFYNNSYGSTQGTIHISAAAMDKGSGELRQRSLADGLGMSGDAILSYRDYTRGLEYLRRARDVEERGLHVDLRGYQYVVLLNWKELPSTAEQPWDRLCDALNGAGVYNVEEALQKMRLLPLHEALRRALGRDVIDGVAQVAQERIEGKVASAPATAAVPAVNRSKRTKAAAEASAAAVPVAADARLSLFAEKAKIFVERAEDLLGGATAALEGVENGADLNGLLELPRMAQSFTTVWPAAVRRLVPSLTPSGHVLGTWAPLLATVLVQRLAPKGGAQEMFDQAHLRSTLAEVFAALGIEGEDAWRASAYVRVMLGDTTKASERLQMQAFWAEGDVRWLAGVNEADGKIYVNRERFEELLVVLQIPALLARATTLRDVETDLVAAREQMKAAGYELGEFLWSGDDEAEEHGDEAEGGSLEGEPVTDRAHAR